MNSPSRWLILGASGFIGSRVAALAAAQGIEVIGVARQRREDAPWVTHALDLGAGDAVIDELVPLVEGVSTVIHAMTAIGSDPLQAHRTNVRGTRRLVAALDRVGSRRLIALSTASVTGRGPHRGVRPHAGDRRPESVTSTSRAQAEQLVVDSGGTVLRPNLVYGAGDVWFVPTLTKLLRADPGLSAGWTARVSTIHVDDLARAVVALGGRYDGDWSRRTVFASAPEPTPMSVVADVIRRELLAAHGESRPADRTGDQDPGIQLSTHQQALLAVDNWFDTEALWQRLGLSEPRSFALDERDLQWYRSVCDDSRRR